MRTIEIDGSYGEGGGQILRTALSLSCITGHTLKLFNIRKGRKKQGLMPQHATCINAAARISHARVSGNDSGSMELTFIPGRITAGNYVFDIKTAGSTSLVFQTLLPPLLFAPGTSRITIKGGTHVPLSPTYHYISEVFLPMLNKAGVEVGSSISRYGFYPRGGGEVSFKVNSAKKIGNLNLKDRGSLLSLKGYSVVSCLPGSIAERQTKSAKHNLSPLWSAIKEMEVPSPGAGTFLFLKGEYGNAVAGFSSLGKKGKPAEEIGREAAEEFMDFHTSPACLDQFLADQIVLYLSFASGISSFTTARITEHLLTNVWVIEKFLNIRYEIMGDVGSEGEVRLY